MYIFSVCVCKKWPVSWMFLEDLDQYFPCLSALLLAFTETGHTLRLAIHMGLKCD